MKTIVVGVSGGTEFLGEIDPSRINPTTGEVVLDSNGDIVLQNARAIRIIAVQTTEGKAFDLRLFPIDKATQKGDLNNFRVKHAYYYFVEEAKGNHWEEIKTNTRAVESGIQISSQLPQQ